MPEVVTIIHDPDTVAVVPLSTRSGIVDEDELHANRLGGEMWKLSDELEEALAD